MFTTLAVAARDRKRLTEISGIAARFGLGAVLARLGLGLGLGLQDSMFHQYACLMYFRGLILEFFSIFHQYAILLYFRGQSHK